MSLRLPGALLVLCAASVCATSDSPSQPQSPDFLERARALHQRHPVIDGHNDYPWAVREKTRGDLEKLDISRPQPSLHTDIARLRSGGVGGQFWSVYVPADLAGERAVTATLEQFDIVHRMLQRYPETFELALTASDVERIIATGKIASLIGVEGGHSIDSSLGALRMYHRLGARYLTLTHSRTLPWADSATDRPRSGGLSPFGEEVVREMNRLGMLVDLSHVSRDTMEDAIRISAAPVIFSHSSARALTDVPRNVPDAVLRALPANGGIVMVTFVPGFISTGVAAWSREQDAARERVRQQFPKDPAAQASRLAEWQKAHPAPRATLADAADHIDHVRRIAGIDHVGLGGDYDGIQTVPEGLEDVAAYPALTAELLRRGYSEDDIARINGGNILRVMRRAEEVAARLQRERGTAGAAGR